MENDIFYISLWWLTWFVFGFVNFPLTLIFFKSFVDTGWGFAKLIGVLILSYTVFLISTFKIFPITSELLFGIFILLAFVNLVSFFKNAKEVIEIVYQKKRAIVISEILFTLGLLGWSFVRGYQPDINGLEKLMDIGFINSITRSDFLPPTDMWFAGASINYYWFGHFVTAVVTKMTTIPSFITYNLMIATILGLVLASSFSIASTLLKRVHKFPKRFIFLGGIFSAFLLAFAGNFHTPLYVFLEGVDKYWYPDATRFIGYNPDTLDKTIHEFPLYSFVVSDLHAHLLNLPFVLLFIAILLKTLVIRRHLHPKDLIPPGFVLGIMYMTNTWDFGSYLLLAGVAILVFKLTSQGLSIKTIVDIMFPWALIFVIGILTALPFIFTFDSIAQGIDFVKSQTPIWQLTVLWGFPLTITALFSLGLFLKKTKVKKSDLFVIALLSSCWMLIFIPEVIFVKDIYIASHHRANTMFKLTYQAFVVSYLAAGYIAVRITSLIKSRFLKILVSLTFLTLFSLVLIYPFFAVKSYYQEFKNYKGLSGDGWLKQKYPGEYGAVLWLNKNISGQPTILEAPGDSYTDYNVISSYTGLPTVSGWFVHEWLWRGASDIPQGRVIDIEKIYTSTDTEEVSQLLKKYQVSYVIVGTFERQKYQNITEEKFNNLGRVIFESGNTRLYKLY